MVAKGKKTEGERNGASRHGRGKLVSRNWPRANAERRKAA